MPTFPEATGALDLYTLLVVYVFGSFWMSVIGIALILFVILGLFGKISIYSTTWYCVFFLFAMSLGYGFVFLNIVITLSLIIGFYFSWKGYIDKGGS